MRAKSKGSNGFLSVDLCGPLCLCVGTCREAINHRGTEIPQSFTERSCKQFAQHLALVVAAIAFSFFLFSAPSIAKEAQPNEDPKIEQRMKALTEQLRCLVCQNETLADSRADLAEDLRKQIREQMRAGKSDQEILAFLTQRYGDFVLYKPPVKKSTYVLWFGPFVLLVGGTVVLYRYLKSRRELIKEQPLSADERTRAEDILRSV
jgi:cytochrome c-type biogenesis protein CcmH